MNKTRLSTTLLLIGVFFLTSCEGESELVWKKKNISQILPVGSGYSLFCDQNTFGLLDSVGNMKWSREVEGIKQVRLRKIDNKYVLTGDTRLFRIIDLEGETQWEWIAPTGSSAWIVGSLGTNLIVAVDSDTNYDKNPIYIQAVDIITSIIAWRNDDVDYSGVLKNPSQDFSSPVVNVPTTVGTTAWIDGIDATDGNHLWRVYWDLPPPGQPIVLAANTEFFWAWRVTGDTYQVSTIDSKTGKVIGTAQSPKQNLVRHNRVGNRVYVEFEDEIGYFDSKVTYQKLHSTWFPLCGLPGSKDRLIAVSWDCQSIATLDVKTLDTQEIAKTSICYNATSGKLPGEVFLTPAFQPYDYNTMRIMVETETSTDLAEAYEHLMNVGRDGRGLKEVELKLKEVLQD
ncbi:MAG TPA: hypothetical protein PKV16_08880 [Caldisericia bacterium]|nr:hypothetical protein [Caldisericia bacterium]HPF49573.1 hypothetical protein [Caldisericia bacterium]HPI84511.1 hypothetical protein [Caldisericia bacterium]HPQ93877.1 hypothetical protein [Caldisericia bacterium]HRV75422.1 hypothetical protein [Caldisericia bacterium]